MFVFKTASLILFSVICFIFSMSNVSEAHDHSPKLVFSQILGSPAHAMGSEVLKKLYSKLNINIDTVTLPSKRALKASSEGKTDGEVFRIAKIGEKYSTLIKIPTPFITFIGAAYIFKRPAINSVQELKAYRVGVLRGAVWSDNLVKGPNVVKFDHYSDMLEKLMDGGIDVIVAVQYSLMRQIKKDGLEIELNRGIPLEKIEVFHYLHVKHKDLVETVNNAIILMHENGEILPYFKGKNPWKS